MGFGEKVGAISPISIDYILCGVPPLGNRFLNFLLRNFLLGNVQWTSETDNRVVSVSLNSSQSFTMFIPNQPIRKQFAFGGLPNKEKSPGAMSNVPTGQQSDQLSHCFL